MEACTKMIGSPRDKWACGPRMCMCEYCMGQRAEGGYFCRPGYYTQRRTSVSPQDHDDERIFKDLNSLAAHRLVHKLSGARLEGELDNMRGAE